MPKLSDIYGADDNAFAQGVASEALSQGQGSEDIWGALLDAEARSKGNKPTDDGDVKVSNKNTGDGRAKTNGNHGAQD
jgi:hypothetical protein